MSDEQKLSVKLSRNSSDQSLEFGGTNSDKWHVLRLEVMSHESTKKLLRVQNIGVLISLGWLCGLFIWKLAENDKKESVKDVILINIVVGSFLTAIQWSATIWYISRLICVNKTKKIWSQRRKRVRLLMALKLFGMFVNNFFYLFPNVYAWIHLGSCDSSVKHVVVGCGTIRWIVWNFMFVIILVESHSGCVWNQGLKFRKDSIILDAPIYIHWPKCILFIIGISVIIIAAVFAHTDQDIIIGVDDCDEIVECKHNTKHIVLTILLIFVLLFYFAFTVYFLARTFKQLKKKRYQDFRMGNIVARIQMRLRMAGFTCFVLSTIFLCLVDFSSCQSYAFRWMGLLPAVFVINILTLCELYMMSPKKCESGKQYDYTFQQFYCWTERHLQSKKHALNQKLLVNTMNSSQNLDQDEILQEKRYNLDQDKISSKNAQQEQTFVEMQQISMQTQQNYNQDDISIKIQQTSDKDKTCQETSQKNLEQEQSLQESQQNLDQQKFQKQPIDKNSFKSSQKFEQDQNQPKIVPCKKQIFCYERAIKLFWWSCLVYEYENPEDVLPEELRQLTEIHKAMELFNLDQLQVFHEPSSESKAIIGWNQNLIVVSFRGSLATVNWINDLRAWRVLHPPKRGSRIAGTQPLVHDGFWRSWASNGFGTEVINFIQNILNNNEIQQNFENQPGTPNNENQQNTRYNQNQQNTFNNKDQHRTQNFEKSQNFKNDGNQSNIPNKDDQQGQKYQIFVTGHSLGGAIAQLAAFDMVRYCNLSPEQISVYTYGCPRVGNYPFGYEYERTVHDTWNVINNQDIVTRAGKFIYAYKRAGYSVLINSNGDLLVQPSYIEISLLRYLLGKVNDHFTISYQEALSAVLVTQLDKRKRQEDDLIGVLQLAQNCPGVRQILKKSTVMDKFAIGQRTLQRLATFQIQKFPENNLQQAQDFGRQESLNVSEESDRVKFVFSKFKNNANFNCVKVEKQYVQQQNENLSEEAEKSQKSDKIDLEKGQQGDQSGENVEGRSLKSETSWSKVQVFIQQGKLKHILQSKDTEA